MSATMYRKWFTVFAVPLLLGVQTSRSIKTPYENLDLDTLDQTFDYTKVRVYTDDDTDTMIGRRRSPDNSTTTPQNTNDDGPMEALTEEEYQQVDEKVKHVLPTSEKKKTGDFLPDWDSLDKRKLPDWYEDAKFGIFVHWGLYSVPAYKSEWFWWHLDGDHKSEYKQYMQNNYPHYSYQDFAPHLTAKNLDTDKWAELVEASGAKYFLFTSKHHEGFTFWKSDTSWNWNSVDMGPKRDIVSELKASFDETNVTFGLYFSLYEWFNPWYKRDKLNDFETQEFVHKKIRHQLQEIVERYEPWYIWSDGDWEAESSYWNSTNFLAWLYNESPVKDTVVTNDRWGQDANCVHGDVKTCKDRYNPGKNLPFKWENAMTIDKKSWGYRHEATADSYIKTHKLVETLIETVSCGGNVVMNIAPTADGRIIPIYEERLREIGKWLKVNGDAIYGTRAWRVQKESSAWKTWYTVKGDTVFAIMCRWPKRRWLVLQSPKLTKSTKVSLLGYKPKIEFERLKKGLRIDLHKIRMWELESMHGFTFALQHVK